MPVVDGFIYLRHSKVWADQEDGTFKIDLPFLQHRAPVTRGFLFVEVEIFQLFRTKQSMVRFGYDEENYPATISYSFIWMQRSTPLFQVCPAKKGNIV